MFQGLSLSRAFGGDLSRLAQENSERGNKEGRSNWNWNTFYLWASDEVPAEQWFPGSDDEKGTLAFCYTRTPMVHKRGDQH